MFANLTRWAGLCLVEMNDYPYTDRSTDKPNVERTSDLPIGKVRLLEDVNDDGRVLTGMIAEESAVSRTLKRADNKADVVLRQNITEIAGTGLSLMPEGLEKKITIEEMSDLLAFLRGN